MDNFGDDYHWQKLPQDVMREIAERARKMRKQRKYSQAELADRSGVSLGSLKRFESTGKISLEALLKLAFALSSTAEFEILFPVRDQPESLDDLFK